MAKYRLSKEAKADLIRIHQYGTKRFGEVQADKYFNAFFDCFNTISQQPFAFETVDYIKKGYLRCVCGVDSIYYRITDNMVEIMAIVGKQDLKNML